MLISSTAAVGSSAAPEPTSSAMVVKTITGSHVITIDGYSTSKGVRYGQYICSGTFGVVGYRWSILYYPNSDHYEISNWVSIFLTCGQSVKARFTISLLDKNGDPVPWCSRRSSRHMSFSCMSEKRGFSKFIKRKALEKSGYLRDDYFRIRCDITVLDVIHKAGAAPVRFITVPPSNMEHDLGHLLYGGKGADITFEVAGEKFAVHKNILAIRSPVFMEEFFGLVKEKAVTCVRIDDMEARVFKALLHFVYMGFTTSYGRG